MSAGTVTTSTAPTSADRLRQVGVTLAEVFCVVGTLVGVGVIGTRVEESSGGALAADATLVAPAGPAFSIWTPIYLGLLGYTVWQWLPQQAAEPRHRAIGWLVAASMVLNAGWLLVTQQGWLWASVVVIIALALTLGLLVRRLQEHPSYGHAESVLVDGTFGLYLGWVSVATVANVTTTLIESGVDPGGVVAEALAVVVLAVAAGLGVLYARRFGGRWAVAVAMAWGLAWIGWGRLADEPASTLVGGAALVAAVVVLAAPARVRPRLDA
ncbi:TspO/MBR family protein [Phycicoccus sonneratiae]|uniref:Tryptophan-rich sensory protein n=1 Tax=Phycicoccus sonneratiae TaxID=2807628 RepID=A0ABS2CPJ1_9MICO|nr:TspO/MBR family protein [Phycicoccus sonneraticus]MBM6401794.1 tryptophan-rich sensory protein [Phycicoccus sonneraticus]